MKTTHHFFALACLAGLACVLTGCPICSYVNFTWDIAVLSDDSLLIEYPQHVRVSVISGHGDDKVRYPQNETYRVSGDLFITGDYGYSNLSNDEDRKYRETEQKVKITRLSANGPVKIIVNGYEGSRSPSDFGWLPKDKNMRDSVFEELVHWYGEEKLIVMPADMNEVIVSAYKPNTLP